MTSTCVMVMRLIKNEIILILLILLIAEQGFAGGPELKEAGKATEADDQSLVLAVGAAEGGTTLYRVQYLHPLWNRVQWAIGITHSTGLDTEEVETTRTDAMTGLRFFPFKLPVFAQMGLGISKASSDGFRTLLSLGYIVDFSDRFYGELGVGRDFIQDTEDRWTGTLGLGTRF